jgi:Protein of unknown function (DUF4019)
MRLALALLGIVLLGTNAALAQDPRTTSVQQAAPAFLALLSTTFKTNFAGAAAEGDYALLLYRTSFANRTDARETVTLEREPDGTWRVIGYFIR